MRAGRSGEHKDWATIGRGQLVGWGLPVIAMIGAGAASEWQPIAEIVETAYRSGLRAAAEVRAALETGG